jgi:adenylate cyclase
MSSPEPKPKKKVKGKSLSLLPVIVFLLAACAIRIIDPEPAVRLRLLVFDIFQRLKPRLYDPALPVRIVDFDDGTLAALGQWPPPRSLIADLVSRLNALGAGVIAFDMVFAEPDRFSPANLVNQLRKFEGTEDLARKILDLPSNDTQLAKAISDAPVVLAIAGTQAGQAPAAPGKAKIYAQGQDPRPYLPAFEGAVRSLPQLVEAAAGEGAINWTPEYDQVVRRVPLAAVIGHGIWPSLAAETLRLSQPGAAYGVISRAGLPGIHQGISGVMIGGLEVPVDANGQMWLHHTAHDPRRFIPAHRVLEGETGRGEVEGRIILVGTSATGLQETRTTPLEDAIPGVEIHAQAVEQMLLGDHLRRPSAMTAIETGVTLLGGLLLIFIVARVGAAAGALAGGLSLASAFSISWIAYARHGILFDAVYPAGVLTGLYILGTAQRYFSIEAERNRVRSAFGRYLSPAFVEVLARDPSRLELGGEMRRMTILFSDVRNFTEISEKLDAVGLTSFLNRLLAPLSDTILRFDGTIDKFIGDAVMAFWNAPLEEPFHARKAALAALQMQEDIKQLNETLQAEAAASGKPYPPVMIGIGLNTGPCCVGNLGTSQRFDYSVIGDTVNVASRLEGLSKTYGVGIVAGAAVAEEAPDLAFIEIGIAAVKGRSEAIRIYTLLGGPGLKSEPSFQLFEGIHNEGLEAFRRHDFQTARHLFAEARKIAGSDLSRLYDHYDRQMDEAAAIPASLDLEGGAAGQVSS